MGEILLVAKIVLRSLTLIIKNKKEKRTKEKFAKCIIFSSLVLNVKLQLRVVRIFYKVIV